MLVIPDCDGDEYPGSIEPGIYDKDGVVAMLRDNAEDPDAIVFIADMME